MIFRDFFIEVEGHVASFPTIPTSAMIGTGGDSRVVALCRHSKRRKLESFCEHAHIFLDRHPNARYSYYEHDHIKDLMMRVTAETKQETRQRILDAARKLFCDKGFRKTTTRDLAAEASIATGTLFNYFPSKEHLALAIIDFSLNEAGTEFAESRHKGESMEETLFAHVAIALRHLRPHRSFVGDVVESTLSPFSRANGEGTADSLRVRHLETVREIIERHASPSTPLPSAVTMHLYWTMYLGVLAYWAKDESPNQEDALVLLDQALRLFVGSLDTNRPTVENTHAS